MPLSLKEHLSGFQRENKMKITHNIKKSFNSKWWHHQKETIVFEKLLLITAKIGEQLPSFLQKRFIQTIDTLGLWFFRISTMIGSFFAPYYLFEGVENQSEKKFSILYQGYPGSITFFTKLFFKNKGNIQKIEKSKVKKLLKKPNEISQKSPDLFIKKSDLFFTTYYQKKGWIVVPEYISFVFDTSKTISTKNNTIVQDIKKAKKTKYSYEVRNDRDIFKLFYHNIYLPYVTWKHKEKERIASYATIRHLEARGANILLIKHDDEIIFGGMFLKEKEVMKTYYAGLMKGKFSHLHNGVMALSYYYLIEIAKDFGCKIVDFGTARPFLGDGLYKYKNKWHMDIQLTSPFFSDIFAIQIINTPSVINDFISTHPIHYINGLKIDTLREIKKE